jgi:hypothetical protein
MNFSKRAIRSSGDSGSCIQLLHSPLPLVRTAPAASLWQGLTAGKPPPGTRTRATPGRPGALWEASGARDFIARRAQPYTQKPIH